MTDRIHSLTVVLENDVREDDLEPLIAAIRCLRGVLSVSTHVSDLEAYMAKERARHELGQKLLDVVYPKKEQP